MTRDPEMWLRTQSKRQAGQRQSLDSWLHDDATSVEPVDTTPPPLPAASITQGPRGRQPLPRPSAASIFDEAMREHVWGGSGSGPLDVDGRRP